MGSGQHRYFYVQIELYVKNRATSCPSTTRALNNSAFYFIMLIHSLLVNVVNLTYVSFYKLSYLKQHTHPIEVPISYLFSIRVHVIYDILNLKTYPINESFTYLQYQPPGSSQSLFLTPSSLYQQHSEKSPRGRQIVLLTLNPCCGL